MWVQDTRQYTDATQIIQSESSRGEENNDYISVSLLAAQFPILLLPQHDNIGNHARLQCWLFMFTISLLCYCVCCDYYSGHTAWPLLRQIFLHCFLSPILLSVALPTNTEKPPLLKLPGSASCTVHAVYASLCPCRLTIHNVRRVCCAKRVYGYTKLHND